MGNTVRTVIGSAFEYSRGNKRKIEEVDADEDGGDYDGGQLVAKKRRGLSTSRYIYKTLFEEGWDSDITVIALQKEWHLHKVYLCQSPYFRSMFSGNWKEANLSTVHIEILDDNITVDALQLALGLFYRDDLEVEPVQVIPLLATAVLLQMDGVIEHCTSIMHETINIETVLLYHEAARRYGLVEMERDCRLWLLHNLLTQVTENPSVLRHIPVDLMRELVLSPHLYVMQTECSIYVMLKVWVFLKLNPIWDGRNEAAFLEAHKFFQNRKEPGWFLEAEGKEFADVFSALRLVYLIYHHLDVEMLHSDRILPPSWLQPAATWQWYNMLRVDQEKDRGPVNVSEQDFDKHCMRCGRVLATSGQHIWRWTGYNFGLDLVMLQDGSVLRLKRNHRSENVASISQNARRHIMYRVSVASSDSQNQVTYMKSTGIQSATLSKNEEIRIITLDPEVKYPLLLSANFLVITPSSYPLIVSPSDVTPAYRREPPPPVAEPVEASASIQDDGRDEDLSDSDS